MIPKKNMYIFIKKDEEDEADKEFETISKIRKRILDTINRRRVPRGFLKLFIDIISNQIATEYSLFLMNNNHDQQFYEDL